MFSLLKPSFVYTDISEDITENDIDVVSELWTMDGREVYRGSRDPRYTHANVYWLYNEDLMRVGCSEHALSDHADVHLLWFRESEFGTLLQEDGWQAQKDIWSHLPSHTFERFINEGWTSPEFFLEQCLQGPTRILTPQMVVQLPKVYVCNACGRKSLRPISGCAMRETLLDIPDTKKVFFVDVDMITYVPPENSAIWSRMRQQRGDDSSSQEQAPLQAQEREQVLREPQPQSPAPPQPDTH